MTEVFAYKNLSARERALVAAAVLIDGADAISYLDSTLNNREVMLQAVQEFLKLDNEHRLPVVASVLRRALKEMGEG